MGTVSSFFRRRPLSSRAALAGLTIAGLAMLSGCAPAEPAALRGCVARTVSEATPADGALFGVNPDWGDQTLGRYAHLLGNNPAVAVSFADVPLSAADEENVRAAGEQVRGVGGILLFTLEPREGLAAVTDAVAADVAALVDEIQQTGAPVVVRFAHEMNGSWYTWGQQPTEYVASFRRVADALRAGAPGSAMMWAPNEGGGYPFVGGSAAAVPGADAFALLDTDGDGILTIADDPYAPYYPGDDVVDWVGMSLYHWGAQHPWGANVLPEPDKFALQLTGEYNGTDGDGSARLLWRLRYRARQAGRHPRNGGARGSPRRRCGRARHQAGVVVAGILRRDRGPLPAASDDQLVRVEQG
jgi:hypothetical protein